MALGVDLGTSFARCALWEDGVAEAVADVDGHRATPAVVAVMDDGEVLTGDAAWGQAVMRPERVTLEVKRAPGDGTVAAHLIRALKQAGEARAGRPIAKAAVGVPAWFGDAQRRAMRAAAEAAGFASVQLVSEHVAAAMALRQGQPGPERQTLVVDFGGGSLDVALVVVEDDIFEVRATASDPTLGGEQLTTRLVDHWATEFRRKHRLDPADSPRAMRRLRVACERAKRALSSQLHVKAEIDSLHQGVDFQATIGRSRFEDLVIEQLRAAVTVVERALGDAGVATAAVDDVVLVGGAARMPRFQRLLSERLGVDVAHAGEEAVARGLAMMAAIHCGDSVPAELENVLPIDALSRSVGIEASGGVMERLLRRGTTVPCTVERTFSTYSDSAQAPRLRVLEGERALARDCQCIGEITVDGVASAPRGVPRISLTFAVSAEGVLSVSGSGVEVRWLSRASCLGVGSGAAAGAGVAAGAGAGSAAGAGAGAEAAQDS